jgi:hypothetical protein
MSYIQYYRRLYEYVHEYQKLVHEVYADHVVRYLVTYYNINKDETIWEDEKIFGGAYHDVRDLTGIKWDKILLLPVYFPEDITSPFDGQDVGYIKDNQTTIVFPSTYGIIPYPGDMIKLEQEYLRPNRDIYPIFRVEGVEISTNTDRRYWKMTIRNFQSRDTQELEDQVARTLAYSEYDKKIHTLSDSQFISRLLSKHEDLRSCLKSKFDSNSGFYFV